MTQSFRHRWSPNPAEASAQPVSRFHGASVALAIVLIAAVLRSILQPVLGKGYPFITFEFAVMLAALFGGLRAGALATLASALVADYFWIEPVGSLTINQPMDWLATVLFIGNGILVSVVADRLLRFQSRLRRAETERADALERQVHERATALVQEIAERQQADAKLLKATALLRAIGQHSPEPIYAKDPAGRFLYANPATLAMIGKGAEVVLGRTDAEWHSNPEQAAVVMANDQRIMRGGVPEVIEETYDAAIRGRRTFRSSKAPFVLDDGSLAGIVCVSSDITERKAAEAELRASKAKLDAALAAMSDAVFISDSEGRFVEFNDAFAIFHRLPNREAAPTLFADYPAFFEVFSLNGELLPVEQWPVLRALRGERAQNYELVVRRKDTGERWIGSYNFDPIRNDDRAIVGAVITARDITAAKTAEVVLRTAKAEAEKASQAKSKFLAAASHDLRQPVQSLTLLLSVIKRQVAQMPKAAEAVLMAETAVNSLTGLLTGILDISKLDAGLVTPFITSVDLDDLTAQLACEYQPRAAAKGLAFRRACRQLHVRADPEMLERILRNLLENALRYTKKGGVLLAVRRRGENVRLDVVDTGIGIPPEKQMEIFEEFRQLHNPARDSSRGLGLGLAIASRLARLLGAEVQVASKPGHGSRFSLVLPLDHASPAAADAKPTLDEAGGRVLVIEDNADLRRAYEVMLGDWGYATLAAATGEEAIDLARQEEWRFDVILADHRLGRGLTGAEAATEIARRAGRAIPTMIVTGDTAKERITEIHGSGFVMLHKPVEAADLRQQLAMVLRGHATSRDDAGLDP